MNEVLKTQSHIDISTEYIKACGWITHDCVQKNWDLAHVLPCLRNGNILDMGCFCSFILPNAVKMGLSGDFHGIDTVDIPAKMRVNMCRYHKMDLCHTTFGDGYFDIVTCLSVLEHDVNHEAFIKESSRLVKSGGSLFVTFDYWPTKYQNLPSEWKILDHTDGINLIRLAESNGFRLTGPMNWNVMDKVLQGEWFFPVKNVGYTFAYMEFRKQ